MNFEDYAVPIDEGEDNYIKRAKNFLLDLFRHKICHIEYFDISEDCYVEIFYRNNAYTYNVMAIDYDEYYCRYYWAPARNVVAPGWYDTKERAIEEAKRTMNYGDYKEYTI